MRLWYGGSLTLPRFYRYIASQTLLFSLLMAVERLEGDPIDQADAEDLPQGTQDSVMSPEEFVDYLNRMRERCEDLGHTDIVFVSRKITHQAALKALQQNPKPDENA